MLRTVLITGLMSAFSAPAMAAVVMCANVGDADGDGTPNTLADYIDVGSCQVGDLVFSNFSLKVIEQGGTVLTEPKWVEMTPINTNPLDPGLKFLNPNWSVIGNIGLPEQFKMQILYTVKVVGGQKKIKGASLILPGSTKINTPGSTIDVYESIIPGPQLYTHTDGLRNVFDSSKNFAPVATFRVNDLVDITVNNPVGAAKLVSLTNQFSLVPEPISWAMMLVGFGGVGMAMRFRRNLAAVQLLTAPRVSDGSKVTLMESLWPR